MEHTIKLKVSSGQVVADPNPLPGVRPGDTVTFQFVGAAADGQFEVEFHEVRRPCPPEGPFAAALEGAGPLSSTVAPGQRDRFLYNVFRVGRRPGPLGVPFRTRLTWARGMEGGGNFGGIDVQPPPPPKG